MDHQQANSFPRAPPPLNHAPPTSRDPYQRPPQVPPPIQSHPWPYSNHQFQYQFPHSSTPPTQWPPQQPHSYDHARYPPPLPPPYPSHQPPPYPSHLHYPPSQPLPTGPPNVYAQDFGGGSWGHQQIWDYPTNNNKEDWAEKARAWAVAKAATDNQYTLAGRPEDKNNFHNQHSPSINPQFSSLHVPVDQASSYLQHPMEVGPPDGTELSQSQDSQYVGSGQSSHAVEVHVPYSARDGSLTGNSYNSTPQKEKSAMIPLAYQQEVPSSYSSVSGNDDYGVRYEKFNSSSSLHVASMPHLQAHPQRLADGRSGWAEEPHHLLSSQSSEPGGLADRPLNFDPHFNRNLDHQMQPSEYAWPPSSAPAVAFSPVPPPIPSGPQADHQVALPSAAGHTAPIFSTAHGFQAAAPLIGSSFGVGSGVVFHTAASFSVDAYGVSSVSERPKKAPVPNWLREEIIKSKAVITSSVSNLPNEDSQSIEEDSDDKYSMKGDQTDNKSVDSSRSNEDEDEDEDVEAARTAAINKEIKRVLTEVLMKVTDELFDEIATKVINADDDLSVEVGQNIDPSNRHVVSSTPTVSFPATSAKVIISTNTLKVDNQNDSEKSTSGSAGDVLGLANYASDEDDDEIKISGMLDPKDSPTHFQSLSSNLSGDNSFSENGDSRKVEEHANLVVDGENLSNRSHIIPASNHSSAVKESNANNMEEDLLGSSDSRSSKKASNTEQGEMRECHSDIPLPEKSVAVKPVKRDERFDGNLDLKKSSDDSRRGKDGNKPDKNDVHESKRNSAGKDKDSELTKLSYDKKGYEDHRRPEDKHARTGMSEYRNGSKDKGNEKDRNGEKAKDSEARKRLSPDLKEVRSDTSRDKRNSYEKTREKKDVKKDKSSYKDESGSSRHKPYLSSPIGSRDSLKDNLMVSHSSDKSSDDSRRKSHYSKRHRSPSPIRSRKRQVSRSPHSKHSKRRHTPYSSLENSRGRKSQSKSPVHRRR